MYIHNENIEVRYYETDKAGIVHHSEYVRYMEIARVGHLKAIGISYAQFEKSGYVSPALSVELKYKYPAFYGDIISVQTKISDFNGVRIFYEYTMKNGDDKVVATASSSHAICDKDLRPVMLKKVLPEVYEKLLMASK